jgi:glutaconyl-CoA decarboxylase
MAMAEAVYITILGMATLFIALGILILTTGMVERLFRPKREGTTRAAELRPDDRNATPAAGTPASPDTGLSEEELQKFRLGINNRGYDIGVGGMKRSPISVIVNGERFEVLLETPVQTVAGRTKAETEETQPRPTAPEPKAEASEANVAVKAPMPGRIISVSVKVGDRVAYRDVVCVLEAMKMENEIVAPVNGFIKEVKVSAGEDVSYGDTLVIIGGKDGSK